MTILRYRRFFPLLLLGFIAPPLYAETETTEQLDIDAITKEWKCKYCPDLADEPWEGDAGLSLGYVSNDSYKFGEYNGLAEKGAYLKGDIDALYRDDEANYFNAEGYNLGLDSSYLKLEGGRQGTYKLNLTIDQITKYNLDTSRTPYSGDSTQNLPAGWVNASTTAGFSTLGSDLHDVNFSTQRRHFSLSGEYISSPHWSYGVEVRRKTKDGSLPTGFSFGFTGGAILPKPIDYTTDEIELSAQYRHKKFNGRVAFIHSSFKNEIDAFRWDNAYDSPVGATQGQAGTAPDNTKQQLLFTGNYLGIDDVQLTGLFSFAQMTQDESFLPYTSGTLVTPALPTSSLDGKVLVFNTNLAAYWQYSAKQQWHFIYEHHEQDNSTERNTYTYVTADNTLTSTPRANFPYSFRQQTLKVNTNYEVNKQIKLSGGGKLSLINRDYQSVERTEESSLWAKLKYRIDNDLQFSVKGEYSDRNIDNYNVVSEVTLPDNPLMRKYNMADRNGQKLEFNLAYSATDNLFLNFSSDLAQYDYDASEIGLTESDEFSIGLDVQYTVDEDLSFNAFMQNTNAQSKQAGSQTFSNADWFASNDDDVLTIGLGSKYQIIEDKLSMGLDYVHAESSSAINISVGEPFPDLTTQRDTLTLYGDYIIDEKLTVKASYQYENYDEDNWYIDNVAPDTLSNVLTLGETAPNYNIGVIWISLLYNL